MFQITLRSIRRLDDRTYITVGDTQYEIPGITESLRDWIAQQLRDPEMVLLALLLAIWEQSDPTLSNVEVLSGKTISLDLSGDVLAEDRVLRIY